MPVANPVTDTLPAAYAICRLFLEDGTQIAGVWTGEHWWAGDTEVFPTHWAPLPHVSLLLRDDGR